MADFVAERRLLFSRKGSSIREELVIRIGRPYLLSEDMVVFPIKEGFAGCHVDVQGVPERYPEIYGADSIQAINLASNIDPFLRRLSQEYDLFYVTGEPYFDD